MVKMKTYTIKERKDGCAWKPLANVKIYASNWHDAKREFTEWVIGWLGDVNQDSAIKECDQLRKDYFSGKYIDTYRYDVYTYTIKEIDRWSR